MDDFRRELIARLLGQQDISLTEGQEAALAVFQRFASTDDARGVFLLTGSAGTGKTFLINLCTAYLRKNGWHVVLLAPTGRAAKVITRRTQRPAYTIHHHIYETAEDLYGGLSFALRKNKEKKRTVYIVDEASMIGDQTDGSTRQGLLLDLLDYAFDSEEAHKLMLVGDPVQLPPVGHQNSPALDADYLRYKGKTDLYAAHLDEVKRQEASSGLLENAMRLRDAYLAGGDPPPELLSTRDVQQMESAWDAIETYLGYYREGDPDRVLFITYSNFRAVKVNEAIRAQLFHYEKALLLPSDLLMVVRNNYAWGDEKIPFIANGEMCTVREVDPGSYEEKYGLKWMDAELEFFDVQLQPQRIPCKVILDLLDSKLPQVDATTLREVVQARARVYEGLPPRQAFELLQKDPYANALQVKYGYAVTGHKAQGGQWGQVIVGFEPDYGNDPQNYLRWAYTTLTRAEERVFLLDCPFW